MPDLVGRIGWQLKRLLPRSLFDSIKAAYRGLERRRRDARRSALPVVSRAQLVRDLRTAGICDGDTLFVHSSLSRIGQVDGGAKTVVEALLEAVGPTGNLVMPAYSSADDYVASLKAGAATDLRTARSVTGKITETFREMPGVLRSSHPFSSCIASGSDAAYIVAAHHIDPRICHKDSPLARVLELRAKILGLGTDLGTVSIYHCAEDIGDDFPFRTYGPDFEGRYIDANGDEVVRTLRRYDPEVSKYRIDQPFGDWIRERLTTRFERAGIVRRFTFGAAPSWVADANDLMNDVRHLYRNGVTIYTRQSDAALAILNDHTLTMAGTTA